jgi:hypothetical protein
VASGQLPVLTAGFWNEGLIFSGHWPLITGHCFLNSSFVNMWETFSQQFQNTFEGESGAEPTLECGKAAAGDDALSHGIL